MTLIKFKRPGHKDPEVELVARLLDRAEDEGTVSSPTGEIWTAPKMVNGYLCSVDKYEKGYQAIGYKQVRGKDIWIDKLPVMPTREAAERILYKIIGA